jgi:hypothetical protein
VEVRFTDIRATIKDTVNLPVVVIIMSEKFPQEQQLHMQVVSIAKSSRCVHQCGEHWSYVGWVVMGPSVEEDIRTKSTANLHSTPATVILKKKKLARLHPN